MTSSSSKGGFIHVENIIPSICCSLQRLLAVNDLLPPHPRDNSRSRFHSSIPSSMSLQDYITRIYTYSKCSGESIIIALIYIDRIIEYSNSTFTVNSCSIHRVILTSILIATKFFDDRSYCNNAYFAKIGGVTKYELNSLEIDFIIMLRFNTYGNLFETFLKYYRKIYSHILESQCTCCSKIVLDPINIDKNGNLFYGNANSD